MSSELAREIWNLRTAPSLADLTRRYRQLCKLYHPDLQEPEVRARYEVLMQEVNEAYSEALKRFNIYTFKSAKAPAAPSVSRMHVEPERQRPPRAEPARPPAAPTATASQAPSVVGQRLLAAALATLNQTRTFFSLHGSDDPKERAYYEEAIGELHEVLMRCPGTREAQDALYYTAVALCNMRYFAQALKCFARYAELFPDDTRSGVFHFYAGLCQHRLGDFEQAVSEYGFFLLNHGNGQYKHFAALVAGYMESARAQIIPHTLPYA